MLWNQAILEQSLLPYELLVKRFNNFLGSAPRIHNLSQGPDIYYLVKSDLMLKY